jgi:isopentenyl-diphosphate delta-isomerase type 1
MSEEIFDVVNDQDEVVGQAPRSEVHRRKLNHRAVHVLVFNERGQLFLQKRSMTKDCFPGTWDSSASGHLDRGESYDACAIREVGEELGVRLEAVPQRLFKVDACAETGHEFVWVYQTQHEGPFNLHPEEIDTGGWFAAEDISLWMKEKPAEFASGLVLIWRRWLEQRRA